VAHGYNILVGNGKGEKSLRRHRHRWEDNIKIGLRGMIKRMWTGFIWLWIETIEIM
jgi:hypothetical protein